MEMSKRELQNINAFLAKVESYEYNLHTFHIEASWFIETAAECNFALSNFLSKCPVFPSLKHLKIVGFTGLDAVSVAMLVNCTTGIETISIVECFDQLVPFSRFCETIVRGSKLASLRFLSLEGNLLCPTILWALARLIPQCPHLSVIRLHNARDCDPMTAPAVGTVTDFMCVAAMQQGMCLSIGRLPFNPIMFFRDCNTVESFSRGFLHLSIVECQFDFTGLDAGNAYRRTVNQLFRVSLQRNKLKLDGLTAAMQTFLGNFDHIYIEGETSLTYDEKAAFCSTPARSITFN
jgi:hypothetical protein